MHARTKHIQFVWQHEKIHVNISLTRRALRQVLISLQVKRCSTYTLFGRTLAVMKLKLLKISHPQHNLHQKLSHFQTSMQ